MPEYKQKTISLIIAKLCDEDEGLLEVKQLQGSFTVLKGLKRVCECLSIHKVRSSHLYV